ncbi:hypothetical protein BDC45DRAFT_542385 [Circinella umbellata]|nr:hypothetical protein BDC45DRAFT_542385 [Circinella umbellata]
MSTTLSKSIRSGYIEIIQSSLYLPRFWELNEPSAWNVISSLEEALTTDPTLSKRSAQNKILKDVTCLKTHVIPGTIAESMLNHLKEWIQSKQGKASIKKYWRKYADELETIGIDERIAKRKIKRAILSEIADDMKASNTQGVVVVAMLKDRKNYINDMIVSSIRNDWKQILKIVATYSQLPALCLSTQKSTEQFNLGTS